MSHESDASDDGTYESLTQALLAFISVHSAYKAAHASDEDALLAERGRLDNSHSMIDGTLE